MTPLLEGLLAGNLNALRLDCPLCLKYAKDHGDRLTQEERVSLGRIEKWEKGL